MYYPKTEERAKTAKTNNQALEITIIKLLIKT
jgi:hypothetical protein